MTSLPTDEAADPMLSVVIPCKDEADNLPPLIAEIVDALHGRSFEIVIVNDGSEDDTVTAAMQAGLDTKSNVRVISHSVSSGKSAAERTGLQHARGDIIISMDGDGQNNPAYIPTIVDTLVARGSGFGMIAGQRLGRKDTAFKRFASRFANRLRGAILKDKTRDAGCGFKAVHTDIFLKLPYFEGRHRFMAALVLREGYDVDFVDVVDRPRQHGVSKYGVLDRALVGSIDLIGVLWLMSRFKKHPAVSEEASPELSSDETSHER